MTATAPAPTGASPALAAFLRGSGRRALLFAQLQCGDRARGDAAALAALPRFASTAVAHPMAQWPRRFWASLLAEPLLRAADDARWPPAFETLGAVGPGARAALLLWLVAGLGEEEAATALGVGVPAWRLALQRAAPLDADGVLDTTAWRALESEVREVLRALPPERLEAWDRACGQVAGDAAPVSPAAGAPPTAGRTRRWLVPALAACVLALAATLLLPWPGGREDASPPGSASSGADPVVERRALPARNPPPAFEPGDAAVLLLHPDFDLLAGGGDTPLLRDLGFHAWYAAQRSTESPQPEVVDAR